MNQRLSSRAAVVALLATTISAVSLWGQAPANKESGRPQPSDRNLPFLTIKDATAILRAQGSRVRVIQQSQAAYVGRIGALRDDSFDLKDEKSGLSVSVRYDQVTSIGLFREERKPTGLSKTGDIILNILTAPIRMIQCLPGGCC